MKVIPYTEHHAIRNVLFAIEFSQPVPPSVLVELKSGETRKRLMEKLPRVQEIASLVLELDASSIAHSFSPGQIKDIGGYQFDALKANGEIAWMLNIQPNQAFVLCGDYKRWNGTWTEAKSIFEVILPWLLKHTSISAIALQYVDEFTIVENEPREPLHILFNSSSKYLPRNAIDCRTDFHSHHGFFLEKEELLKSLINVNVNVSSREESQVANIMTLQKVFLRGPAKLNDVMVTNSNLFDDTFNILHQLNKEVFGDLITEEVKRIVNFNKLAE